MKDKRDRSFLEEFAKWFFIWKFVELIFKGITAICKFIVYAISKLAFVIGLGIRKISPIIKRKFAEIKVRYNTEYREKIKAKWLYLVNKFSRYKLKFRKINHDKTKQGSGTLLIKLKKTRYYFYEFWSKYEIQLIAILIIILLILAVLFYII